MNAAGFRRMALGLAGVVEGAHMKHADFRTQAGRIFASLNADETVGNLKLQPDEQGRFLQQSEAFSPAAGAWGRSGWTRIALVDADDEQVGEALTLAWRQATIAAPAKNKAAPPTARANQAPAARRPSSASGVDDYIKAAPAKARSILKQIRAIVREEAPQAEEKISYRMPAFFLGKVLIYMAAFKAHIGIFPPVAGDAALLKALAKYRGPKGNLRFPLDEPTPYPLIRRVVRARIKAVKVVKRRG